MGQLENEFNEIFNNHKLTGDGLDSNALWDDIANDLDEAGGGTNGQALFGGKGTTLALRYFSLLGIVAILIYCFAFMDLSSSSENLSSVPDSKSFNSVTTLIDNESSGTALRSEAAKTGKSNASNNENKTADVKENIGDQATNNKIEKDQVLLNDRNIYENEVEKETIENAYSEKNGIINSIDVVSQQVEQVKEFRESQLIQKESHTSSRKTQLGIVNESEWQEFKEQKIEGHEFVILESNSVDSEKELVIDKASFTNSLIIELPVLPSLSFLFISNKTSIPLTFVPTPVTNDISENKNEWSLGVYSGINALDFSHRSSSNNEFAELKNSSEKLFPGFSYGLNASVDFKQKLFLTTGIEFHQLWTKFDYSSEVESDLQVDDLLLKVWINEFTGDTISEMRGTAVVKQKTFREVVHFNEYKRTSLPIQFGIQNKSGKLNYGVSFGLALNFTQFQSGRLLDENNEIQDFENADDFQPLKSFGVGLRLSPFLRYNLNNSWSLNIFPNITRQSENIFESADLKMSSQQLNLSIGLNYLIN